MMLRNMVLFRACFGANRITEFVSVFEKMHPNLKIDWDWDENCVLYRGGDYGPTLIQRLPNHLTAVEWADIAVQCVGCRGVFQVLGEGDNLAQCVQSVGNLTDLQILKMIQGTWSIQFRFLGRSQHLHPTERTRRIESFREVLGVLTQRTVSLESPDHELWLLEDHRILESADIPDGDEALCYCGLWLRVKSSIHPTATELVELSDVKKRPFIHTTTMPADRALLMANLAKIQTGSRVLDPFCGSGGLLLAASLLGGVCVGADIDVALLCHRDQPLPFAPSSNRPHRGVEKVSYMDSFAELKLSDPKILVGLNIEDATAIEQFFKVNGAQGYQSILTDPPYGIRESISLKNEHQMMQRLCEVGQNLLTRGGRLVYLHVMECQVQTLSIIQSGLEMQIQSIAAQFDFRMISCAMERFNGKLWRATIVLERQNCTQ